MTPRTVHQLVHTLSYGDAISTEVLALQEALRRVGCVSEIIALHTHHRYGGRTKDLSWLQGQEPDSLILHYSLGSPLNDAYRAATKSRRILIYHNITPPSWFRAINPRVTKDIELGIADLEQLCRLSDSVLADSNFNASEIRTFGIPAEVLELPIDPQRWTVPVNPGIAAMLQGDPRPHILHVGRLAPNKSLEDLIKVMFVLVSSFEPQAVLWIVGIDIDTELYSFALKRMAREFKVDGSIRFTGPLADEEIRAFYEHSSLYLSMSEHEGFCYPVLEAMHFGLPVIAYGAGAVTETVGDGGIVVYEKRHGEIAALASRVYRDQGLRASLKQAGQAQAARFSFERFEQEVKTKVLGS